MKRLITSAVAAATAFSLAAPGFAMSVHFDSDTKIKSRHATSDSNVDVKVESNRGTVDLACMQTAVEKRDNAMIAAQDAYSASWKTALQTRRDELKAAWGIQDKKQREEAIRAAWKKFRESRKTGRENFRTARKNAWNTFKTDSKACKAQGNLDASLGASLDAQN